MELLPATFHAGPPQTVHSEWIKVPKVDLAGPLPWYKTVLGTADPTEESPGSLIVVGVGTDLVSIEVYGVFEFKTSLATANTPAVLTLRMRVRQERSDAIRAREKSLLVSLLSSGQVKPAP
jgi:hypothetical protein